MLYTNCTRKLIVQAACIGTIANRSLQRRNFKRSLHSRLWSRALTNPWNCKLGGLRMMVDTPVTGSVKRGSMVDVLPEKDDDGGYASGGWKSEDGKLSCGYLSFRGKRATMEDFYDIKLSSIDGHASLEYLMVMVVPVQLSI